MENQTVTIENVITLADNLAALPKDANQNQLAEAIADATLIQIAAVSNHNWFEVEHRDGSEMGKTIAPSKKEIYTTWKSSNPSVKYGRVRVYGRELATPALMAMIAAIEDEAARAEAYLANDLVDPSLAPVEEVKKDNPNSKNRDLYERSVVELGKIYRALNATDNDAVIKAHEKSKELQDVLVDVTNGLKSLGAPTEDEDLVDFMKSVVKR